MAQGGISGEWDTIPCTSGHKDVSISAQDHVQTFPGLSGKVRGSLIVADSLAKVGGKEECCDFRDRLE